MAGEHGTEGIKELIAWLEDVTEALTVSRVARDEARAAPCADRVASPLSVPGRHVLGRPLGPQSRERECARGVCSLRVTGLLAVTLEESQELVGAPRATPGPRPRRCRARDRR